MLTVEDSRERIWGKYPSLRKALENKPIPDSYYGPTLISDNMFDAMVRFVTMRISVNVGSDSGTIVGRHSG